eukprot:SAG31_NODE_3948_length_3725_cov_2.525372_1_plen_750_part_00
MRAKEREYALASAKHASKAKNSEDQKKALDLEIAHARALAADLTKSKVDTVQNLEAKVREKEAAVLKLEANLSMVGPQQGSNLSKVPWSPNDTHSGSSSERNISIGWNIDGIPNISIPRWNTDSSSESGSDSDGAPRSVPAAAHAGGTGLPLITHSRFISAVFHLMADGALPVNPDENHAGRVECIRVVPSTAAKAVSVQKSQTLQMPKSRNHTAAEDVSRVALVAGMAKYGNLYQRSHDDCAGDSKLPEIERRLDQLSTSVQTVFYSRKQLRQYWVRSCARSYEPNGLAIFTLEPEHDDLHEFDAVVSHLRGWAVAQKYVQRDNNQRLLGLADMVAPLKGNVPRPPIDRSTADCPRDSNCGERGGNGGSKCGHRSVKISKYVGVSWASRAGKWVAQLGIGGYLGHFQDEHAAAHAFDDAARRLRGSAAHGGRGGRRGRRYRLNFPTAAEEAAVSKEATCPAKAATAPAAPAAPAHRPFHCDNCGKRSGKNRWCTGCLIGRPNSKTARSDLQSIPCEDCGPKLNYNVRPVRWGRESDGRLRWCKDCKAEHPDAVNIIALNGDRRRNSNLAHRLCLARKPRAESCQSDDHGERQEAEADSVAQTMVERVCQQKRPRQSDHSLQQHVMHGIVAPTIKRAHLEGEASCSSVTVTAWQAPPMQLPEVSTTASIEATVTDVGAPGFDGRLVDAVPVHGAIAQHLSQHVASRVRTSDSNWRAPPPVDAIQNVDAAAAIDERDVVATIDDGDDYWL